MHGSDKPRDCHEKMRNRLSILPQGQRHAFTCPAFEAMNADLIIDAYEYWQITARIR